MKMNILFLLPAFVSFLWPILIAFRKKKVIKAQWLMAFTMVLVGLSILGYMVWSSGPVRVIYVYDFIYGCLSMLCVPTFYMFVCSLTSSKGLSLRHRQIYWLPVIYVVGVLIIGCVLGPREYQQYCLNIKAGNYAFQKGNFWYNAMMVLNHYLYVIILAGNACFTCILGAIKLRKFHIRFNTFYAERQHQPKLSSAPLLILSFSIIPLVVCVYFVTYNNANHYTEISSILAVAMTIVQMIVGHYAYTLSYSAEQLAQLMDDEEAIKKTAEQ